MSVSGLIRAITIFLFVCLTVTASPAEAKRAKFYTDDKITLMFSGSRIKATGDTCSLGSRGQSFSANFIFRPDGTLASSFGCGENSESHRGKWWVEDNELCMNLKGSGLIRFLPTHDTCWPVKYEQGIFGLYAADNRFWELEITHPRFSSKNALLAALKDAASATNTPAVGAPAKGGGGKKSLVDVSERRADLEAGRKTDVKKLAEYRNTEAFKDMHLKATKWMLANLFPYGCKNIKALNGGLSDIIITEPIEFSFFSGEPDKGKWRETTKFFACGKEYSHHIDFVAKSWEGVKALNMAPGGSIANARLQGDLYQMLKLFSQRKYGKALLAMGEKAPAPCKVDRIINTEMVVIEKPPPKLTWREKWFLDYCGTVVENEVRFETVEGGVMFKVDP